METDRKVVATALLFGALLGFAMTSGASGEELVVKATPDAPSSSSARVSISVMIIKRPGFSCGQILRAVTVEIAAFPPLPDDHLHSAVIPRSGCTSLQSMFSVITEITPDEPATGQLASAAPVLAVPAGTNSPARPGGVGSSGHRHGVEVVYNFE